MVRGGVPVKWASPDKDDKHRMVKEAPRTSAEPSPRCDRCDRCLKHFLRHRETHKGGMQFLFLFSVKFQSGWSA